MRSGSRTPPASRPATGPVVAAVIAVVLALVLAGCGDDTDAGTAADPTSGSPGASPSSSPGGSETGAASTDAASSTPAPASPSLPSVTDATEDVVLPECSTVWVDGQKLPRNYPGCTDGGTEVPADGRYCEFGKPLFTYRQRFYAVENGRVNRTETVLAKDPAYQRALRSCGG